MSGRKIVCQHCKRWAPRSQFNHAYCGACEQAIRQAYLTKHLCPRCGSEGIHRGRSHWTGVDGGGGFHETAFCPSCRERYEIPDLPVVDTPPPPQRPWWRFWG